MQFAIIDIETTGSSNKFGKITEVAIVISDGVNVIDKFETLINPEKEIPYNITRLTGIDNSMVTDAPKFYEVAKKIIEMTEDKIFVAHNVNFDYGFIKKEFEDLGYNYQRKTMCSVKLARKVYPNLESYSLGKICKHFNIPINGRHRAMGDAYATAILFHQMVVANPMIVNDMKFDSFLKEHLQIAKLPNKEGIYYFKNNEGQIIYVGKSKRIKSRVQSHLLNYRSKKGLAIIENIAKIDYLLTGNEIMALLMENKEIKRYKPIYNRAQKNTIFPFGITIDKSSLYHKLKVIRIETNDDAIIGFKSKREANSFLMNVSSKYDLCEKINELEPIAKNGPCFKYQIKQCKGACVQEESCDDYNARIQDFESRFHSLDDDYVFVGAGRNTKEISFVLVEKGIIKAFGYSHLNQNVMNSDQLKLLSEDFNPDKDFQRVVKYLVNNKDFKKIKIN